MKQLAALSLLLASSGLLAQDCLHTVSYSQAPDWSYGWSSARLHPSGNVSWTEWTLGMSLGLTTPDGQQVWDRRIIHGNPVVGLTPFAAEPRPDGGHLLSGGFNPGWAYDAPCIVSLSPTGDTEWARIYMTDSTDYGAAASIFQRVRQRPDGDVLVASYSRANVAMARLGPDGTPLWHNRYVTETSESSGSYTVDVEMDLDNSATVLASTGNGHFVILHADADGNGQWGYTYPLSPTQWPTDLLRANDGSYYVASTSSNGGLDLGYLIHLNSDGTLDWMKSYSKRLEKIEWLPNGDLLASTERAVADTTDGLLRLDASGTPLAAWSSTISGNQHDLIGVRGDSVYVLHYGPWDDYPGWSALTVATSVDNLSCAFTTTALPTVTTEVNPVSNGNILTVVPDELKSWTMNIGTSLSPDDVDVQAFAASGPARPGFFQMVYLAPVNQGGSPTSPLSSTLTFDPVLTYFDAYPPPTSIVGNSITWTNSPALDGYDSNVSYVQFSIPADPGLIGTILTHTFSVTQDSTEVSTDNNTTVLTTEITGSYDPNDKQVLPRDFYHIENDSILDYTIQFQNTGNDTAFTVVVVDTLPLAVDVTTIRFGASSHAYTYTLTGNGILTFTFANILLPDSNTNEPLSHGLVNFKIKPILPLALGQEITNTADIYFDFNDPVRTPDATVVVTDETGVRPVAVPEKLNVFPIPVKNSLTALLPGGFAPVSAFAIGIDGRRVPLFKPNVLEQKAEYNVQHLVPGAYVLTLVDRNGKRMSARFTKE